MSSVRQFQIFFDRPNATYQGGEMLTGRLITGIVSPIRIRGLELHLLGEAVVSWSESRTETDSNNQTTSVSVSYGAKESYIDQRIYVHGGPSSDMLLEAGQHIFPFSMQLRAALPSSMQSKCGNINYILKAKLICINQLNQKAKVTFNILSPRDLSQNPHVKEPVQVTEEKHLWCCCCKSGPITAVVLVPFTGFVSGQEIPLTVEVDNATTETLYTVNCSLQMVVKCWSSGRDSSPVDVTDLAEIVLGKVNPNGSQTWHSPIMVPSIVPLNVDCCKYIDVEYRLLVLVKIAGVHRNLQVIVPVVMGTVPIMPLPAPSAPLAEPNLAPSGPEEPPPAYSDLYGEEPK